MAEIAGLILGVAGLAGLIGAFKDTIELFNDFADSRHLGREYEILDAKFDIERTLLLQWEDQVRLLQEDYDRRLDEPHIERAVANIMACIKHLLSHEKELVQRYGIGEIQQQASPSTLQSLPTMSAGRLSKFFKDFENLKIRANAHDHEVSLHRRVRWIIRDKQKFEKLVTELGGFVMKLYQIMPTHISVTMTNADLRIIGNLKKLKKILAASRGHRHSIAESTKERIERRCEERILETLWFRRMNDRQESLASGHQKTLQWALEPPSQNYPWDDLSDWLRHDSGIYWVSGKAGSGKSTLMKYLFHHDTTESLLSEWTKGQSLSIYHFFFYNLGTSLQKTQEGLSRALLWQILSDHRSLISQAFPDMWKQLQYTDEDIELPSKAEIAFAFDLIAGRSSGVGKFCLFIDGLDEFEGDYSDGITFLQTLAANENIKIVVSSRPIPDCVSAFKGLPNLQLHDLNQADIESYTHEVVGGHPYMQKLALRNPAEARGILDDIIKKSSGVFFWVVLACRSLISGFSDCDRIGELRKRVDELPSELGDLFKHMLSRIGKRHRQQGAQWLRMLYLLKKDYTHIGVSTLPFALVDDGSYSARAINKLTFQQNLEVCEQLRGRLRSRCGGLLELSRFPGGITHSDAWIINSEVDFMHRTVLEFLASDEVWELDCLQPSPGFDVFAVLSLVAWHLMIPRLRAGGNIRITDTEYFMDAMYFGRISDSRGSSELSNIFWIIADFLESMSTLSSGKSYSRLVEMNSHNKSHGHSHAALALAVEAGALNYVKLHPECHKAILERSCNCFPLLYHAVAWPTISAYIKFPSPRIYSSSDMVNFLLSIGGRPNQQVTTNQGLTTPWLAWQKEGLAAMRYYYNPEQWEQFALITEALLKAGSIITVATYHFIQSAIKRCDHPTEIERLEKLLELVAELQKAQTAAKAPMNHNTSDPGFDYIDQLIAKQRKRPADTSENQYSNHPTSKRTKTKALAQHHMED